MHLSFDQPWFMLLWIVALSILLVPIIVGGVNAVVNNYFSAKERHLAKIVKAIGETIQNSIGIKEESSEKTEENSR